MTFIFPYLTLVMGYAALFLLFAAVNVYAMYFLYFYLPETRGHGLDVAYKLVDEMYDTAPQLMCWREETRLSNGGGVSEQEEEEATSLLHKD
jgi:hypothetical protein